MKHYTILVDLDEWFHCSDSRTPSSAIAEMTAHLEGQGFESLDSNIRDALARFSGGDQITYDDSSDLDIHFPGNQDLAGFSASLSKLSDVAETHLAYVSVCHKNGNLVFVDTYPQLTREKATYKLEIDVFSSDLTAARSTEEMLIDAAMRCFGLAKSREELVSKRQVPSTNSPLMARLRQRESINHSTFEKLSRHEDRAILRALKKRGSILEDDLGDLIENTLPSDKVQKVLDYMSGSDHRLVDKKVAILCRKTREILFQARSQDALEKARDLECSKCSRLLGDETKMAYYGVTDSLKDLLDGNRWMPLYVKQALVRAGVPRSNIFVEVKHGEDEIDVLVFYRGRVFVMETKDRAITLNDAYKLSAKTSRLERVETRLRQDGTAPGRRKPQNRSAFLPILISTGEIAKDARELMTDISDRARFFDNCEGSIDGAMASFIAEFDGEDARRRFQELTRPEAVDSIANLVASRVTQALDHLWQQGLGTSLPPERSGS